MTVLHHPSSASLIRRQLLADLAGTDGDPEFAADAAAVATELVGNAVRHARPLPGGVLTVDWRAQLGGLEIRVTDGGSPKTPLMRRVPPESISGRGLAIVATLAAQWGVAPDDRGRCVWAWLGQLTRAAS
ncbi:MAG: ATP-binding protein [Micromonosporaceae bacterium]